MAKITTLFVLFKLIKKKIIGDFSITKEVIEKAILSKAISGFIIIYL